MAHANFFNKNCNNALHYLHMTTSFNNHGVDDLTIARDRYFNKIMDLIGPENRASDKGSKVEKDNNNGVTFVPLKTQRWAATNI